MLIGNHMRSIKWWRFRWPWRAITQFSRSQHIRSWISQRDKVTI